jgi:hypothetical protein
VTLLNVFRLGLRFARPRGYVSVARAVAIVLISALGTGVVLVLFSAAGIVLDQQRAADARFPRSSEIVTQKTSLPLVQEMKNDWHGQAVTRVVVAGGERRPGIHPPGVARNPRPGEIFASQAALDARSSNPGLRRLFDSTDLVGRIGPEGLVNPAEIRIIQGAFPQNVRKSFASPTEGFGDPQGGAREPVVEFAGPVGFMLPLVVVMAFGPMVLALVLASRLMAPETNHRFALLGALGVGRGMCRVVAAVELLPAAAIGSVAGWMFYGFVWRRQSGVPGTDLSFWPGDTGIHPVLQVLVPAGCVLLTLFVSAIAITVAGGRSTQPFHAQRRPRWWWLIPFACGVAMLGYATLVVPDRDPATQLWAIRAAGLMMVSTPLVLHLLVHIVSGKLSVAARTGGGLVGARWAGNRQGASFRLAITLSVGMLALCATAPFVVMLKGDTSRSELGLKAANGYNLGISYIEVSQNQVEQIPGARKVLPYAEARTAGESLVNVFFASCGDLILLAKNSGCNGEPQWISEEKEPMRGLVPDVKAPIHLQQKKLTLMKKPDTYVYSPIGVVEVESAILVDPGDLDTNRPIKPTGFVVNLADGLVSREKFEGGLAAVAPVATTRNGFTEQIDHADAFVGYLQFMQIGVGCGLVATLVALAASALRSAREQRQGTKILSVLGGSRRARVTALSMSQGLPVFLCMSLSAAAVALLWAGINTIIPPETQIGPAAFAALPLLPFLSVALMVAVTLPTAMLEGDGSQPHADLWSG